MRKLIEIKSPLPPFIKGGESNYLPCKVGGAQQRRVLIKNPPLLPPVLDYSGCPKTQRFRTPYELTPYQKAAFTLAEVLITLGIIGVVAAMTLPTLVGNYKKAQTVSQLKKVYSVLSQSMLSSVNANGDSNGWVDTSLEVSADNSRIYFDKYWKPYLKIIKVCDTAQSCGYSSSKVKYLSGKETIFLISSSRTAGFLPDGTFLSFVTISWDDEGAPHYSQTQMVRVDLNGSKPPNMFGRDTFTFVINLNNNSVKPACYNKDEDYVNNDCKRGGAGECCLQKIINDNWTIKDDYPWK